MVGGTVPDLCSNSHYISTVVKINLGDSGRPFEASIENKSQTDRPVIDGRLNIAFYNMLDEQPLYTLY